MNAQLSPQLKKTATVEFIRGTDEDFQFFPSTPEIIDAVKTDILKLNGTISGLTLLDIGAGDMRVLETIAEEPIRRNRADAVAFHNDYTAASNYQPTILKGIEISSALRSVWNKCVQPVGTDFMNLNLLEISSDYTYTNPPFNMLETWLYKAIRESNCRSLYFVAPLRWEVSENIHAAINSRLGEKTILGTFSFAEGDRKVREGRDKVHLVRIDFTSFDNKLKIDPFSLWLDENFPEQKKAEKASSPSIKDRTMTNASMNGREVLNSSSYVDALIELYEKEITEIHNAMMSFSKVASDTLALIGLDLGEALLKMRTEISNKRIAFWSELFSNLTDLTHHLSAETIWGFKKVLGMKGHLDFNKTNIEMMLAWINKNVAEYNDELFDKSVNQLMHSSNIAAYKSNKSRFTLGDWEYANQRPDTLTHFKINTTKRVIVTQWGWKNALFSSGTLQNGPQKILNNLLVLANNYGFTTSDFEIVSEAWSTGEVKVFHYTDSNGTTKPLMKVKAFRTGTLHIHFDLNFINLINVEFGKRKGWLASSEQAADELEIPKAKAENCFNKLIRDKANIIPLLNMSNS